MTSLTNKASADLLETQHENLRFAIPFEGAAPVQAWGTIGGSQRFYFRWRGRNASLTVGTPSAVQPRTAAEVWSAITGTTDEEAQVAAGTEPLRAGEIYPEGLCVTEVTQVDDNLGDAADVLQSLLLKHERARGGMA